METTVLSRPHSRFWSYWSLLRVHKYIKNLFIFLPLFFGLRFFDGALFLRATLAFVAFSLIASAVYIFNDYVDREADRRHPVKKHRALAAGEIRPPHAFVLMAILLIAGEAIFFSLGAGLYLSFLYLALNFFYTVWLKHVSVLDVTTVSFGLVIRLLIGSAVIMIPFSSWMVLMVFLLFLFLTFGERRQDILIYLHDGTKTRRTVDGYTLEFLNAAMITLASVVIVVYILYVVSPEVASRAHSGYLYLTSIFVMLGVLRYMQIAFVDNRSGFPIDVLLKDRFLQCVVAAWILVFLFILY